MNEREKGFIMPFAIILLFFITAAFLEFLFAYNSEIKVYNSLENSNVRATINLLSNLEE